MTATAASRARSPQLESLIRSTNVITPMMTYFALIVAFAEKYAAKSGIGTIIALMLPYSVTFLTGWTLFLILWMVLGLPVGPGAGLEMPAAAVR